MKNRLAALTCLSLIPLVCGLETCGADQWYPPAAPAFVKFDEFLKFARRLVPEGDVVGSGMSNTYWLAILRLPDDRLVIIDSPRIGMRAVSWESRPALRGRFRDPMSRQQWNIDFVEAPFQYPLELTIQTFAAEKSDTFVFQLGYTVNPPPIGNIDCEFFWSDASSETAENAVKIRARPASHGSLAIVQARDRMLVWVGAAIAALIAGIVGWRIGRKWRPRSALSLSEK